MNAKPARGPHARDPLPPLGLRALCAGSYLAAKRLGVEDTLRTNAATATGYYLEMCKGDVVLAIAVAEGLGDAWSLRVRDYLMMIAEEET